MLLDSLPPESATHTAIRDAIPEGEYLQLVKDAVPKRGHGPWSREEHLLARISDLLSWVIYAQYASQGGTPDEPTPLPRPGVKSENYEGDAGALAYLHALRVQIREQQQRQRQAEAREGGDGG